MHSNTNRPATEIRNEMDLKITDARAVLTAIEALYANSAVGQGGVGNDDIHYLVLIALEKAREAETLSSDLEFAIRGWHRAA